MKAIDELIGIAGTLDELCLYGTAAAIRRICSQIEESGADTVKAEAMEALAFVESHGGLDEVRKRLAPGGCRPLLGADGSPIVPGGVYYGQSDGKRWRVDAV